MLYLNKLTSIFDLIVYSSDQTNYKYDPKPPPKGVEVSCNVHVYVKEEISTIVYIYSILYIIYYCTIILFLLFLFIIHFLFLLYI